MDLLDRVSGPGSDLLERVDDVLTRAGAPADHRIWRLIQRAGALPSAVFAEVGALSPVDLQAAAAELAGARSEVRRSAEAVPSQLDSRGTAAEGFGVRWAALGAQITDDGLTGRLAATSAAIEGVADWVTKTRRSVAGEVGACLGSTEAVLVRSIAGVPRPDEIRAAADIGACVLVAVLDAVDQGWQHIDEWSDLVHEVPVRAAAAASTPVAHHIDLR